MIEQETISRSEVLKELNIPEDTLSTYERELELNNEAVSSPLETFTKEDLDSIRFFHRLRESGLTYNEIKMLSSFAGILKNVEFKETSEIKDLLLLSPVYRLKQSMNLARQELGELKAKAQELENALNKLSEGKGVAQAEEIVRLKTELEAKERSFNTIDRKLSETMLERAKLESELALYKEAKNGQVQIKGKKAKELYKIIIEKDLEIEEVKKKNSELLEKFQKSEEEALEFQERLELMEEDIAEMEHEVEERYQEQITNLREQIESLIGKKQSEWETFFKESSELHRKEILSLQRRHEQEILRLKRKIKEQIEEIEQLKMRQNPFLGLLKIGTGQR